MKLFGQTTSVCPFPGNTTVCRPRTSYLLWQWIQLTAVVFALILTPIAIGVVQQYIISSPLVIMCHVCDVLFAIDVVVSKATWVRKKRKRMRAESSTWLMMLASSALVITPVVYYLDGDGGAMAWCGVVRMLVIFKLPPLYRIFKRIMEENGLFVHETYVRVVLVFIFAIFYSSVLACVWFYISCRQSDLQVCLQNSNSWVANDLVLIIEDPVSRYFRSLYFVVQTLFTIGYGDITPVNNTEILLTLFLILNGSLFYAFMISSITSLLSNRDATTKLYRSETNVIKDFFNSRGVSTDISEQLQGYFDFLFTRKKGVLDTSVLSAMPRSLSLAVKASFSPCLEQVAFFQAMKSACLCYAGKGEPANKARAKKHADKCSVCGGVDIIRSCTEELFFRNYVPGSALANQGDAHRCLFLILSGRVDILKKGSKCALLSLHEGDHVGEETLILNRRWSLSVVAAEYTEVVCLDSCALHRALDKSRTLSALGEASLDGWLCRAAGGDGMKASLKASADFQRQCRVVQTNMAQTQQKKKIMQMLEKADLVDESWSILPCSLFRLGWQVAFLIGIIYYLVSAPLRVVDRVLNCAGDSSWKDCLSEWQWGQVCDYAVDAIMVLNLFLNSFLFAFGRLEGSVQRTVTDHKQIFERFKNSKDWPLLVFGVLPTDLLALQFGYLSCFRLLKMYSLLLLPGAVEEVGVFLSVHMMYTISSEAITVIHLTYAAFFLCIWLASGLVILTQLGKNPLYDFLDSIYWSLTTMTTVGYGDIVPESTWETLFVIVTCIAGPCMCATIIANTASFMKNDDTSENNISHRKYCIQAFVSAYRPPVANNRAASDPAHQSIITRGTRLSDPLGATKSKDIRTACVDYFDLMHGPEMSGLDETQSMSKNDSILSPFFRNHMKQHLIGDIVQASEVFDNASPFIMRKIIDLMEPQYFTKGSLILAAGDPAQYLYFVKSGVVQIYNQHGRRTQRLLQGDFFAPSALMPGYHIVTFRATAFKGCELWVLSRKAYMNLVAEYPNELNSRILVHVEEIARKNTQRITDPLAPAIKALRHINNLREPNKTFMEPESFQYALWCVLTVCFILYNGYMIPLRLAFGEQLGFNLTFLADYLGDLFFIIDIFVNLWILGFYDKDDLVLVRDRIQNNYIQKGRFLSHVLSILPTDLICLIVLSATSHQTFSTTQLLSLCRLNRCIRLLDLRLLLGLIERVVHKRAAGTSSNHDTDDGGGGLSMSNFIRLAKLISIVFYATHIVACIFFFIANYAHIDGSTNNWADELGILRDCSLGPSTCSAAPSLDLLFRQYIYAIYWATATISTVGYGDVVAVSKNERIYNVMVFLVGTSVYAMAVVHLQDIVAQLNVTSGIFKSRCDRITTFLQREGVPEDVFIKNKAYADKLWTARRGASGKELQEFLPRHIYGSLLAALCECPLSTLFFLRFCPPNFIRALAEQMEANFYLPPDFLFFTGGKASRLYLLTSGEIELVNEISGERYALTVCRNSPNHSAGSSDSSTALGEAEFFQRGNYACGARVLKDTHCFELNFESLWNLIVEYKLESVYQSEMKKRSAELNKSSTHFIVNALKGNMKHAKMAKLLNVTQTVEMSRNFFLLPSSPFCQFWTLLSVATILFWALSVPYKLAFQNVDASMVFADVFSTLYFCADVYFNMVYFAIERNGDLITSSSEFRKLYIENELALDLLSSLPIPLMVFGLTKNKLIYSVMRCLHMFRLRQLPCKFYRLISYLEPLFKMRFPENVLRIVNTVATVWYFGHVVCCVFCWIGVKEIGVAKSWMDENGVTNSDDFSKYLTAYLWAMYTIVTVGYGSVVIVTSGERTLAIVAMISGAILCDAGVAAVLSSMIDAQDRQSGVVKRQFDGVVAFCKNHNKAVSTDLAKLMMSYFNYLGQSLGDHDEVSDVAILPTVIWLEMVRRISFRSLCAFDFIETASAEQKLGFVNSLMQYAEPYLAHPGEVLGGKADEDLYVLRRGKVYSMCTCGQTGGGMSLHRRSTVRSIVSTISDNADNDLDGARPGSNKEYLNRGGVIYTETSQNSRNQTDNIPKDIPLAKSVFVTVMSVSDFQDRACYAGFGGADAASSDMDGEATQYPKSPPALEAFLASVNSLLSRGVCSYIRLTCGAQKARTTTENRRGRTSQWRQKKAFSGVHSDDAPVDILWDQNFQFEVPADTNILKLSLFVPSSNYAELADRNVGSSTLDLNSLLINGSNAMQASLSADPVKVFPTGDKDSLHGRLCNGRRVPLSKGSVLPTPTPPQPNGQSASGPQGKYLMQSERDQLISLQDDEYLNSVHETLHTIDFSEGTVVNEMGKRSIQMLHHMNRDGSCSSVAKGTDSAESSVGDTQALEVSLDVCKHQDTGRVPSVIYNSFTHEIDKEKSRVEDGSYLCDISETFIEQAVESSKFVKRGATTDKLNLSPNVDPKASVTSARKLKRRDTLSFKSRSVALDIRNSEGMYVGKIHFKVSVRASNCDGKKREKVKKLIGVDENVSNEDGKYCCESFCHFLRISRAQIDDLKSYYRALNFSVDDRIEELVKMTRAKKIESAHIPGWDMISPEESELEADDQTNEYKHKVRSDSGSHRLREIIRSKVAPASKILSAIRYIGATKKKCVVEVASGKGKNSYRSNFSAALESSNIQGRRRSMIVVGQDESHVSPSVSIINNSRPPSPGLIACGSEQEAYMLRASKQL